MKTNILMVDDQPSKLLSYETILASLGENLIRATSGQEALNLLLKHEVAVVLMDVCMPDLDGFGVIKGLGGVHLPVIIFGTAYDRFAAPGTAP